MARARVIPSQYFDFTARMRLDPHKTKINFGDALFSAGVPHFRIRGGYIYEPVTPYYYFATNYRAYSPNQLYTTQTSELSGGVSVDWQNWHASGFSRRSSHARTSSLSAGILGMIMTASLSTSCI